MDERDVTVDCPAGVTQQDVVHAQAEAQYLARHPQAPGEAPTPFGITIPRSSR